MKELEENKLLEKMVEYQHQYNLLIVKLQEFISSQKDIDIEIQEVVNEIYWDLLDK